jgi:hypothetical protein
MSEQRITRRSISRAAAARNAGQYLRELLRSEPQYRGRWMHYRHERERDVHQLSVAKVLAAELRRHPQRSDDGDVTHERLIHVVSRALKPSGTVLARETLELFIRAFDITDEHAGLLWRQWSGDDLARVISGQLAPPEDPDSAAVPRHETISLREYHYLGPDGRPLRHRTVRDIRALTDGVTCCRCSFDTGELAVERISGGQPGAPYQRQENVWSVDIALPRTLDTGDEHSLEFETRFRYPGPAETSLRRVAHDRLENVVIRVEFDPRRLPRALYWTEWLDYREPWARVLHEEPVSLDSEHAAANRLDVLDRAVAGFRWKF